jgi:hypothetical protein
MVRTLCRLLLGLAIAGIATPALAVTIGFAPSGDITASSGNPITVDIVISDLAGEVVSAYNLDLTYDDTMLTPNFVSFTNKLGSVTAGEASVDADIPLSGVLDILSQSYLSDAELLALQGGDSVTLFTVGFTAISDGTSSLGFVFDDFNYVKGMNGEPLDVTGAPPIPEPSAALVFAVGAALVATAVRRSS